MTKKKIMKYAFKATLPVMAGYLVLGMGFGIILKTNGYPVVWALAMSLFIYAGSMQYVLITLLSGAASFLTIGITTLMVNARHLFYGISMVDKYKDTGFRKPYLIFALTDETYSLVCDVNMDMTTKERVSYYFAVSLLDQIYWVLGSVIGGLLGEVIGFNTTGIDFALTALFLTIFTDQWMKEKNHLPAIIGVISSVVSLLIFGRENFLIPDMILIAVLLLSMKKFTVKNDTAETEGAECDDKQ